LEHFFGSFVFSFLLWLQSYSFKAKMKKLKTSYFYSADELGTGFRLKWIWQLIIHETTFNLDGLGWTGLWSLPNAMQRLQFVLLPEPPLMTANFPHAYIMRLTWHENAWNLQLLTARINYCPSYIGNLPLEKSTIAENFSRSQAYFHSTISANGI